MDAWRLIIDGPASGAVNMATDEVVLSSLVSDPDRPPTLRIYAWSEPTISIGCHQDGARISSSGLPVVRRITGGRAVLHHMEVTYSVAAPVSMPVFAGGINGAYSIISRCIVAALRDAGVAADFERGRASSVRAGSGDRGTGGGERADPACFHSPSRYEVVTGGRKLVGSSQRRLKDAFLQHGSIIMDIDRPLNHGIFGPVLLEKMACVGAQSAVDGQELTGLLVRRFAEGLRAEFTTDGLDHGELAARDGLVAGKFLDPYWFCPGAEGQAGGLARVFDGNP